MAGVVAPGLVEFGGAFCDGMKTLSLPDKLFLKGTKNILGYVGLVTPLTGPTLALQRLAADFHNGTALPGLVADVVDIGAGVRDIAGSISNGETGKALYQTGSTASKVTSAVSDFTDIMSVVDVYLSKVNVA